MTVGELLRAFAAHLPSGERPEVAGSAAALDVVCSGVTHDSRRVAPGAVFVALRGLKADGVTFAAQAIAAGAAAVVAEQAVPASPSGSTALAGDIPWIVVKVARLAIALLAAEFFGHPSRDMRVIGVTGTNGKTTTSYQLCAILDAAGLRAGMLGTVAYRIAGEDREASRTTPEAPDVQQLLNAMLERG